MRAIARTTALTIEATSKVRAARSPRWLVGFLLFEMACQLVLLAPSFGQSRVLIRSASFAASLFALFFFPGHGVRHRASILVGIAIFILGIEFFHPNTNNVVSGIASIGLNVAVVAPLIWVPRVDVNVALLRKLLLLLWLYNATSAAFGVLQVYFPGSFQPNVSITLTDEYVSQLTITLASGEHVLRPMGLTDTPGGAAIGGFYAVLLGVGFLMSGTSGRILRPVLVLGTVMGMMTLYLCQVRSLLVTLGACAIGMAAAFALQRRLGRLLGLALAFVSILGIGFALAAQVGGESVTNRLDTLTSGTPSEVYYSNRGLFLEQTFRELLPAYPFGAGLGRWGMIANYFADYSYRDRAPIHAEIQWTGWLLDGGVPLMVAYVLSLLVATKFAFDVARRRLAADLDGLWLWGVLIFGYDLGAMALTFSYPMFAGNMGLEYWLMNGALFAATLSSPAPSA